MADPDLPTLYHLAEADEWAKARTAGEYRRSTLERSLDEEGFIHASFAEQVQGTADRYYRDRDDIVLLQIDPTAVGCEIRVESVPGGDAYPHLYGPLPIGAVVSARPVPLSDTGTLRIGALLSDDGTVG